MRTFRSFQGVVTAADLDPVDRLCLFLVDELEGRTPCVENDDLRIALAPALELCEARASR
jgi:hypothetical protein